MNPYGTPRTAFKKGQIANPGGFPNSKRKLTRAFCDAFYKDFEDFGEKAIQQLRIDHPEKYCQMIVDMMPQESKIDVAASPELGRLSGDIEWLRGAIESARAKRMEREGAVTVSERPLLSSAVRDEEGGR